MSKSTNLIARLRKRSSLSVLKASRHNRESNRIAVAITTGGKEYFGGTVESDTHLLDFSAEHIALLGAVQAQDFSVREVVSFSGDDSPTISPLTVKLLIDYGMRTGSIPAYRLHNAAEKIVFRAKDLCRIMPFYTPNQKRLTLPTNGPKKNWAPLRQRRQSILRAYAIEGSLRALRTYEGASSYGAAVFTKGGRVYFGGQYSAPDKRLNIHAEMSAIIAALMAGERELTDLGIVTDKFSDGVVNICGCCRQFIIEFSKKFNWHLAIRCFSQRTKESAQYRIEELLPHSWSSNKW